MTPDTPSVDQHAPRHRNLARVLVTLASLVAFLAIFAVWINRQVLDTDNWTRASSQMLESPVIRAQLADYLSDQLYANVDVEGEIRKALPPRAKGLAAPAASALRNQVEKRAAAALARPRVQALWENANRAAHKQLLTIVNGGGSTVSTANGEVVLDLRSLLRETQAQVGVGGRLVKALPANASRVVVMRSSQLDGAQRAARVLKHLPVVLVVLSLALFGGALAVSSGWRRNAVRAYGIGLIAAGGAALAAKAWAGDTVVNSLASTAAMKPVVRVVWDIYTPLFVQAATAGIVYGAILLLGAAIAGPTGWATALRRVCAPYLREPAIAYGALGLVLLLLLAWSPTPATRNWLTIILGIALAVLGLEALRRQTAREFPDAERGEFSFGSLWHRGDREPATGDAQRLDQLSQLGSLHAEGVLSDEEFAREKRRVLTDAGQPPPAAAT